MKAYGYNDTRTWNGNGPTCFETTPWPFTLYNDSDKIWAANSTRMAVDATINFITRSTSSSSGQEQDREKPQLARDLTLQIMDYSKTLPGYTSRPASSTG